MYLGSPFVRWSGALFASAWPAVWSWRILRGSVSTDSSHGPVEEILLFISGGWVCEDVLTCMCIRYCCLRLKDLPHLGHECLHWRSCSSSWDISSSRVEKNWPQLGHACFPPDWECVAMWATSEGFLANWRLQYWHWYTVSAFTSLCSCFMCKTRTLRLEKVIWHTSQAFLLCPFTWLS